MNYSNVLITRPRDEALELAGLLAHQGLQSIVLPAYHFSPLKLFADRVRQLQAVAAEEPPLLVFTSPRSVEFGLGQLPPMVLKHADIASIGPSTARLLQMAGVQVDVVPADGYTSEALLTVIAARQQASARTGGKAFLLASPGGRTRLKQGLESLGIETHYLMVYERRPAELSIEAIEQIEQSATLLVIWTSANSLNSLHQRLPAACWSRLCRAEWLVISDRLRRVARAYNPARVHLAAGPTNPDIIKAVQALACA